VVIGKNGSGKSTLFDVFGFLGDCLRFGVERACDERGRGGFQRIRSKGERGPIEFELYYRQSSKSRPITYELAIDLDASGRPTVVRERLRQRRSGQKTGRPFSFLMLKDGKGVVWRGNAEGASDQEMEDLFASLLGKQAAKVYKELPETEMVELSDPRKLGIATLGALKLHERISAFRHFLEHWFLSYFTPASARSLPLAGPQAHLSTLGDNLGNVVQFMARDHRKRFKKILERIAEKIPGVETIDTEKTSDGRLLLRFHDRGFTEPFYAQQVSDGTLKVFAYLLLLEDPDPPSFLCIEEPENGLYHKLLETLARELRDHTRRGKGASQVFVTTHQPYFVDALHPEEVWILNKENDGFSTIRRANEDPVVVSLVEQELPLGGLWYSDYLGED
jgi:predicted ATPase